MKKLTVSTILFLCVFVCISSVNAMLIEYSFQGNVIQNTGDPFGWSGDPFSLKLTVDSSQPPFSRDLNVTGDAYKAVNSFFSLGGQQIPITQSYSSIGFWKLGGGFSPRDQIEIHWANEAEKWSGIIHIEYPYCTLTDGDPIPVQQISSTGYTVPYIGSIRQYDNFDRWPVVGVSGTPYHLELTSLSSNPAPVPEPATMLLFGTGLVGLVGSRFRKKKK